MPTPIQFLECKQSLLLVSQQNGSLMLLNPLTLSCIYGSFLFNFMNSLNEFFFFFKKELICDEGIVCYQWIEELNIIVGGSENGTLTLWNYPKSLSTSKIFPHWLIFYYHDCFFFLKKPNIDSKLIDKNN